MTRPPLSAFAAALIVVSPLAVARPAPASTPAAWAAMNQAVNRACLSLVDGRNKKITGDTASFPDTVPIELRYIEVKVGRGLSMTKICAYDRSKRRAAITDHVPAAGMGGR